MCVPIEKTLAGKREKKTNSNHSKTRVIQNHSEKNYKTLQIRSRNGGNREKIRQNAMILYAIT